MKTLSVIFLSVVIIQSYAQRPNADDVATVIGTLESYKKAIERLDTAGTGKLFVSKSIVIESGKIEGRYQDYLAHHLGPELGEFKSFTFSDYKADVTVDLPYAFATETYKYTIVLKKDNSIIERKGVATTILKKENGVWKIWQTHTSARRP
ncbi:MAG TPA: nuclear transport factor 2 family protein [Cyclobacteriaceae bacterium]|nr:nuclear transport factor 2 family protein [Cyclobacteriaceae bacterium]HRJ80931.1 nuclear transport factor 2 family protein [Cyclobacteriaceae bacterium]